MRSRSNCAYRTQRNRYRLQRIALDLEVNASAGLGRQRPSGRSRVSETVVSVPVSVSAFSVLRQTLGLSQTQTLDNLPYVLRGKLAGGLFGTMRFVDSGKLSLPKASAATW